MEKSCKSLEEEIFFNFDFVYTHLFLKKKLWNFLVRDVSEVYSSTETQMRQRKSVTSFSKKQSSVNSDSIFSIDKMTIKMLSGTFTCCSNVPKQTQTKHLSPGRPMVTKLNTRGNTGWIFITVFWGESAPQTWIFF